MGHVSHGAAVVYSLGKEHFILTSLTRSFQVFDVKLRLKMASPTHSRKIVAMAASGQTTFTSTGSRICVWYRGRLVTELKGSHTAAVHILSVLGDDVLMSIDRDGLLCLWDTKSWASLLSEPLKLGSGRISCAVHPATYLNKVLVGTESGQLHLWNFKTGKLLFTFAGWDSPVTCLQQSPALDVIAIGLADGRIILHNIRTNSSVMTLSHTGGAVTCLAFRVDGSESSRHPPTLVSGDSAGKIAVWDLSKQRLAGLLKRAHEGGVASASFLPGEPLLVSAGAGDNGLKIWIFDSEDGTARLLRERSGHSAPPRVLLFAEQDVILSGGDDGAVRSISVIQDQRSVELSQKPLRKVRGFCVVVVVGARS